MLPVIPYMQSAPASSFQIFDEGLSDDTEPAVVKKNYKDTLTITPKGKSHYWLFIVTQQISSIF